MGETKSKSFDIRQFFKRWPKFYYFVMVVFGPVLFIGLSTEKFLKKYSRAGKTLNLGSGPHKLNDDSVLNVDLFAYEKVDIVADITNIPFEDGSVARIVSNSVLEHVKDPHAVVSEMYRLLETGGMVYITVPFVYPFHSSPSDYHRWTDQGLKLLFKDFEIVEVGVRSGPFSALDTFLCHLMGELLSFGSPTLNSIITNVSIFIFFPIKLLDSIFLFFPASTSVASVLYCVVKKKN